MGEEGLCLAPGCTPDGPATRELDLPDAALPVTFDGRITVDGDTAGTIAFGQGRVVRFDRPRPRASTVVGHGRAGQGRDVQQSARGDRRRHDMGAIAHPHQDRPDLEPATLHLEDVAHP